MKSELRFRMVLQSGTEDGERVIVLFRPEMRKEGFHSKNREYRKTYSNFFFVSIAFALSDCIYTIQGSTFNGAASY